MTKKTKKMNQIYLYGLTTSAFLTDDEQKLKKQRNIIKYYNKSKTKLENKLKFIINEINKYTAEEQSKVVEKLKVERIEIEKKKKELESDYKKILSDYDTDIKDITKEKIKAIINDLDTKFKNAVQSVNEVRKLNPDFLTEEKKIPQFESILTRSLKLKADETTTDFMIIEIYHYDIMKQLIEHEYTYNNHRYTYAFAGAGQIRDKKLVFINKEKYESIYNQLFAGLTDKKINEYKSEYKNDDGTIEEVNGIILGKLNAYKALCNSSSTPWNNFDINKCIVVPDFEHEIKGVQLEYIDKEYQIKSDTKSMFNPVTDGAGVMLPSVSKQNMQFRGSFFKGLLTPFDYIKFAEINDIENPIVKDVWGKSWDLKKDKIEIIFTASQFKMWNHFKSWDQYKKAVHEYNCEFAILKKESLDENDFKDKPLNYQMIQTLFNARDDELEKFVENTLSIIKKVSATNDINGEKTKNLTDNILEFIGATKTNKHKRAIQNALLLDNTLIYDSYVKQMVKNKKSSMLKEARAGKLILPCTKSVYILPDIIAFGQWVLRLKVTGGLASDEVSCSLFDDKQEVDFMRSPHLYIEYSLNTNVLHKKVGNIKIEDWYITKGLYTSINSTSSFELAYDVDGDHALITSENTFVECAKRHIKEYNVLPLDYEMKKGKPQEINAKNMYNSLVASFGVGIGECSNMITKIFAQDTITQDDLDTVKLLKFLNNQYIDFAKVLHVFKLSKEFQTKLDKLKYKRLPTFMVYAKDKKKRYVAKRNNSTLNRLYNFIKVGNLKFENGKFDYTKLMTNKDVEINQSIIDKYDELILLNKFKIKNQIEEDEENYAQVPLIKYLRQELLKVADKNEVVDTLVKHLYESKTDHKQLLWDMFGDEMVFNLKRSLGKLKVCKCGAEFAQESNNQKYCSTCSKQAKKEAARLRKHRQREKENVTLLN